MKVCSIISILSTVFCFNSLALADQPPSNDLCSGAIPLKAGTTIDGSTSNSNPDDVEVCGDAIDSESPGVWYSFSGDDAVIDVSTCGGSSSFDTQLLVFSGSSCSNLVCLHGDDDSCNNFGGHSHVRWYAEDNTNYFIYVHGFATVSGNFSLTAEEKDLPRNDRCSGSSSVNIGKPITVELDGALADTNASRACDHEFYDENGPGVWFSVEGTGTRLAASVCDMPPANADYSSSSTELMIFFDFFNDTGLAFFHDDFFNSSAKVAVYSGASCDELICLESSSLCSAAWDSVSGEIYHILVHSESFYASSRPTLIINEAPPHDVCSGAIEVGLGTTNIDSNELATAGDFEEDCGESTAYAGPGVWFKIVGTGGTFRANTCKDTSFDTLITIFEGTCDNLLCVHGNDDFCGMQSSVSWETDAGTTYYLLVSAYSNVMGLFSLEIEEVLPPENDACAKAEPIKSGDKILGTTEQAQLVEESIPICEGTNSSQSPGMWYSVEGTGALLFASTCGSSFDTQLSVFAGSCAGVFGNAQLECEVGNDDSGCYDASEVWWFAEPGRTYYILVHGYEEEAGEFVLYLDEVTTPSNDVCENAQEISLNTFYFGSTVFAREESSVSLCFGEDEEPSPGLWFAVKGTGYEMEASTCGLSELDTQISIFSGTCNEDKLVCEAYDDDGCGFSSIFAWNSELGAIYYILVTGYNGDIGNFGLVVSSSDIL